MVVSATLRLLATSSILLTAATAYSAEPYQSLQLDLSTGYDQISSPFYKFSETGLLTRLPGNQVLGGSFARITISGTQEVIFTEAVRMTVSGRLDEKRSFRETVLNYQIASVDAIVRYTHPLGTFGAGPTYQRLSVANQHFRTTAGAQADWTKDDGQDGFTSMILERARYLHEQSLTELDANVSAVNVIRHFNNPLQAAGLNKLLDKHELDIALGLRKEANAFAYDDLSNDSAYARGSLALKKGQWTLTTAAFAQTARYKASAFDASRPRRDQFQSVDVTLSRPLNDQITLRLDLTRAKNRSNDGLFENRFQQVGVGMNIEW